VDDLPVLGGFARAADAAWRDGRPCLVALGDPARRVTWMRRVESAGGSLATVIHPDARISPSARLGRGSFVNAFATIFPGARLGAGALVDNHASVGVDDLLGEGVFVGPGCQVNSRVRLGDRVYLGAGAVLIPGVEVGDRTVVGAGATVTRSLPADRIAAGTPARPLRALAPPPAQAAS
jgi:sugar O-acyltransferase (sialic acid O-acetyltransferase NeuD family)